MSAEEKYGASQSMSMEDLQSENARLRALLAETSRPLISQGILDKEHFAPHDLLSNGGLVEGNVSYDASYKSLFQEQHDQSQLELLQQRQEESKSGGQRPSSRDNKAGSSKERALSQEQKMEESQKRVQEAHWQGRQGGGDVLCWLEL